MLAEQYKKAFVCVPLTREYIKLYFLKYGLSKRCLTLKKEPRLFKNQIGFEHM